MDRAESAKATLRYYFRRTFLAAGLPWNGDNDAEISAAVDDLLEAAYLHGNMRHEASVKNLMERYFSGTKNKAFKKARKARP